MLLLMRSHLDIFWTDTYFSRKFHNFFHRLAPRGCKIVHPTIKEPSNKLKGTGSMKVDLLYHKVTCKYFRISRNSGKIFVIMATEI